MKSLNELLKGDFRYQSGLKLLYFSELCRFTPGNNIVVREFWSVSIHVCEMFLYKETDKLVSVNNVIIRETEEETPRAEIRGDGGDRIWFLERSQFFTNIHCI